MSTQSTLFLSVLLVLAPPITLLFLSTAPTVNLAYRGSGRVETNNQYRGSGRVETDDEYRGSGRIMV